MSYLGLKDYADSIDGAGQYRIFGWRKSPSQATTAAVWFDLSMSPGNPVPNYYASSPAVAAVLNGNEGLFHGSNVSPSTKRLKTIMGLTATATALPLRAVVMDYLLYYPFMDMGTNDEQFMTNSVTLPRWTDGRGVQVVAVMTNPQVTGGATFRINYTNSAGVSGRISPDVTCNTATAIGSVISAGAAGTVPSLLYLPLQSGDTGVRSIESFTMVSGSDVGLICLVLVKPTGGFNLRTITAPSEKVFMDEGFYEPVIQDGAYLNMFVCPQGTLAATALYGTIETVWS